MLLGSTWKLSLLCWLLLAQAPSARAQTGNGTREQCPDNCSEFGTCNPESGRCECPLVRHGLDCSIPQRDPGPQCASYGHTPKTCVSGARTLCLNGCNHQGWCEGGFCLCKKGYYGADCAVSTGPNGRPVLLDGRYTPRAYGVRVYVYELPPVTNTWAYIARVDRPLLPLLMQRLLASGARTANGDEADYYLIPFLMRKRAHTANHLGVAIGFLRQHWPWWDRTGGGHRHLLVAPGDHGRRGLTPELLALTANCTYLTHWGLHANHPVGKWEAAHRPGQDIVVPPLTAPDDPIVYSPLHRGIRKAPKRRDQQLFFAGRICGDSQPPVDGRCSLARLDYSANTRQRMYEHHHNRTGWTIVTHTPAYTEGLLTHKFCLSPTGGGYGRRSVQALIMGCIPVTITDGVHQPYEPELNWARFSVPLREDEIPAAHLVLAGLSNADITAIQGRLRCAAQHMYFSATFGEVMGDDGRYDAFETLMQVLRMRRDHPGLAPQQYEQADAEFADFINCRLKPTGGRVPLCTQNRLAGTRAQHCRELYTALHQRWMRTFYAWPGGAVCGNRTDVSACPRSWV